MLIRTNYHNHFTVYSYVEQSKANVMKHLQCLLFVLLSWIVGASYAHGQDKPNILFCMADDWGWPHAGIYGDQVVQTPSFDRLAKEGVLFHHVYVSSPSCTPSRNALITGKYHWQLGPGANLWSTLPVEHESFVHILRDHGYITGQSPAKTWGPGRIKSWADHHGDHPATGTYKSFEKFLADTDAKTKPFFYWLATSDPHRGYKKGSGIERGMDLSKVHMFPHYPNSDEVRSDVADYYFEVERWDRMVGQAITTLEKNGMLENTIIVMTGDHGMPFPRGKGNLYDSGVRVPFAVRWGSKVKANRTVDDFISMTDVGPTLLEIAGIDVPKEMTGRSFKDILLSDKSGRLDAENRPNIVFGRERHVPSQEKPDMGGYPSRGLRNTEFLYIRNFTPERWPAGTPNYQNTNYKNQWLSDCDGGPTKNYIFLNRDKDQEHRRSYQLCFGKRPAEELYDLKSDPDQLNNVAGNPKYADMLETMRGQLHERLVDLKDPRARDPNYSGFDGHPYFGGGGGKIPDAVKKQIDDN